MKFYDYVSTFDCIRKVFPEAHKLNHKQAYDFLLSTIPNYKDHVFITGHNQYLTEADWFEAGRPYYNIWPSITKYLTKVKLDSVLSENIKLPCKTLLFRFAESDKTLEFLEGKVRVILALDTINDRKEHQFMIWIDVGERDLEYVPILTYRNIILEDSKTIEDCLYSLKVHPSYKEGVSIPEQIIDDCLRIVVSCCLLSQDKEEGLIVPDVLAADREKFERSRDIKYVDKAKRRGKIGWDVGKKLDVSPHWRRAHPALYWTGHGRTIPRIVFRKGAMIHREIVKEIPTGRLDEEKV